MRLREAQELHKQSRFLEQKWWETRFGLHPGRKFKPQLPQKFPCSKPIEFTEIIPIDSVGRNSNPFVSLWDCLKLIKYCRLHSAALRVDALLAGSTIRVADMNTTPKRKNRSFLPPSLMFFNFFLFNTPKLEHVKGLCLRKILPHVPSVSSIFLSSEVLTQPPGVFWLWQKRVTRCGPPAKMPVKSRVYYIFW